MLEYHLGWRDPQGDSTPTAPVHPYGSLAVLAGQGLGLPATAVAVCGAAVELLAHFHAVHREIQDGTPGSSERPALWWLWGPAQAINAGDGFHALARLTLVQGMQAQGYSSERLVEALRLLDTTALALCEGRYEDLQLQERLEVTVAQCRRIAQSQTGGVVGCALALPAILAHRPSEVQNLCQEAGRRLGEGVHYWHDVRRWRRPVSEGVAGPVLNKSKTLPLALALQRASVREKRELGVVYMKRVLEPADIPALTALLERLGAFTEAESIAQQAIEDGLRLWTSVTGDRGDTLREAVHYLAHEAPI